MSKVLGQKKEFQEPEEFSLHFRDSDGEEIGRLWFDKKTYEMKFYGLTDKAAKIFFKTHLKSHVDNYIVRWLNTFDRLTKKTKNSV